jgi:hypothetical protein
MKRSQVESSPATRIKHRVCLAFNLAPQLRGLEKDGKREARQATQNSISDGVGRQNTERSFTKSKDCSESNATRVYNLFTSPTMHNMLTMHCY